MNNNFRYVSLNLLYFTLIITHSTNMLIVSDVAEHSMHRAITIILLSALGLLLITTFVTGNLVLFFF